MSVLCPSQISDEMSFALNSVADLNLSPKISAHSFRRGNETKGDTKGRFCSNRIPDVSKNAVETHLLGLQKHHMECIFRSYP